MRILIIDDSPYKRDAISDFIQSLIKEAYVSFAESYKSAVRAFTKNQFELVVLDMSIPSFDANEGTWLGFGGRDVLIEMERKGITSPVILISQYEEFGTEGNSMTLRDLNEELLRDFRPMYIGCAYYSQTDNGWQSGLRKLLQKALKQ